MKSLLPTAPFKVQGSRFEVQSSSESQVLAACQAAAEAEADYATKAVIAGFLLLEYRQSLIVSHTETRSFNSHTKPDENKFQLWLKDTAGLAKPTAYRWMTAAERIARHQLRIPLSADFTPFIDIEGVAVPMSQALLPDADSAPDTRHLALDTFRQGIFDFMADKSLSEAARAAIDGESPAHRITRAANGKADGGSLGENRKDFPLFAGKCLADCLHHIGASVGKKGGHWKALNAVGKQQASQYLGFFIQGLPTELVELVTGVASIEIGKRRKGHQPEPLALKAIVDKALGEKALAAAKSK